jgi:FlaA1/EpsC-like NDP-sugar epimerase
MRPIERPSHTAGASRAASRARSVARLAFRGRHLLVLDVTAIVLSYVGSLALRFDAPSPQFTEYFDRYWWVAPLLVLVRTLTFIGFGLYQRVWRFASVAELVSIVLAVGASSVLTYGLVLGVGLVEPKLAGFPRSIPIVETLIATALIGGMRFSFLLVGLGRQGAGSATGSRALIVGAGSAGANVARQLLGDRDLGLVPVGFADDAERKGHRLLGLPVLGTTAELGQLIQRYAIGTVLFALPQLDGATLRRLVRVAERERARSLTVPSLSEILAGHVTTAVREIQMEDLLRRAPARIDLDSIRDALHGRDILVTGAGGSIGGELARQVLHYAPRRLVLLGRGENSIYEVLEDLEAARDAAGITTELQPVIMDVRDRGGIRRLLQRVSPDFVFHAAAHKHVSFMERHPHEAVTNNVLGTRNVLDAAEAAGVGRFVFVSTDKAVHPTSVMGASKRVGEMLVQASAERTRKPYVIVRFGNVLSSRGSVVLRFRRQLAHGGPLTVTHPNVRRYFMTLSEAVQLILQASILGERGETFVLDMGAPVLIDELARDLIELHGMTPNRDIQIVYTGLGVGEKLDEELFFADEHPRKTVHECIWVAGRNAAHRAPDLAELEKSLDSADAKSIVEAFQRIVPEYAPAREPAVQHESSTRADQI